MSKMSLRQRCIITGTAEAIVDVELCGNRDRITPSLAVYNSCVSVLANLAELFPVHHRESVVRSPTLTEKHTTLASRQLSLLAWRLGCDDQR